MTDISRPKRTHRRLAGLGAAAAALALTVTLAPTGAMAAGPDSPPGASHAASKARTVDVMTRNLYLGADLTPVILALALNPPAVPAAASATWAAVQATKPEERMAAIADEIVEERPAVVGLQEVTRWTTYSATGTPTVRYDFLELLLKALADRGVVYHEVAGATANNFASPPIPLAAGSGAAAVSLADRDVILRRDGVKTWNAHNGNFTNILSFPLAGGAALPVARGWGSVDVRTKLATFRFVNSHLEAFGIPGVDAEALRYLQVGELLAAQQQIAADHGDLPAAYVGDYNSSAPTGIAYQRLVAGVGSDAWIDANPGQPGLTCCFDAEVDDPNDPLTSRIDLIVIDDDITAKDAEVIGEEVADMTTSGLWPSDHAGVVATLVVEP
jgi:endonuclease/exonuclease/phosphatase family metal-dependent hydrolase